MNDSVNKINEVANFIERNLSKAIVMYPGDCWSIHQEWENIKPISLYLTDLENKLKVINPLS